MTISATSLSKLFTLTDTDKNGKLSATEMQDIEKSLPNPQGSDAATMVKSMDKNGDGLLTEDEFTQGVQLNEKVNNALLSAQEIMSGNTLLELLSGNSKSNGNSLASLYGGTDTDASTMFSSTEDSTTSALLQKYIDKYGSLDNATTDTTTDTKTTTEA